MTSHPKDLSDALIDDMARATPPCARICICRCNRAAIDILAAMNRRYTREHYLDKVRKSCARPRPISA